MRKLTEEEMDIVDAIHTLVYNGKIPFETLEPVYDVWYERIEDHINEAKEKERKRLITECKMRVSHCMSDVESTKQKIDKTNDDITGMKKELQDLSSKGSCTIDEERRMRELLWWIFNCEKSIKPLEEEYKEKEAKLKDVEDELKRMETSNYNNKQ